MCKFIFLLRPRHEINEPRRDEGHEGKKVLERFCRGQVYFFKIGMLSLFVSVSFYSLYFHLSDTYILFSLLTPDF
jgi:hypothetical protein